MVSLTYQGLIQQLRPYFTQPVLKRGWQYFKDDTIKQFQVEEGTKIKAIVHGSVHYLTQLDLKQFRNSRCNCPVDGYCKHMAAVLFEAAYRAGLQPKQLLSPTIKLLPEPMEEPEEAPLPSAIQAELDLGVVDSTAPDEARLVSAGISSKSKQAGAARYEPVRKTVGAASPKEDGRAADWHRYFGKIYDNFSLNNVRDLEDLFEQAMERLLPYAAGWKNSTRLVYGIHVILFLMKKADELKADMMRLHYYRLFAFTQAFSDLSDQCYVVMADLASRVDRAEVQSQAPGLLEETADYLEAHAFPEHASSSSSSMPWEDVYGLLWRTILQEPALVERERSRIDEALTNNRLHAAQRDALVASRAFFDVLARKDRQARAWLDEELSARGIHLTLPLLEGFAAEKDWDRLVEWLEWLAPAVKLSSSAVMELYVQYWKEASKHLELESAWLRIIRSMLPESYPMYAEWLLEQQRFQEWVDLNVIFMRSPSQFSAADLKQVEAYDGRLLLPLYHFAVERLVLEKNRASYKSAVRLLKKLAALYKRLKETERWNQYIEQISKQYSRYRAFQEELRKGKLQ